MGKSVQPMLASGVELDRLDKLKWPLWASPKYDGIRAIVREGIVVSRTLKPIPSKFVQQMWGRPEFEGFDGELICGSPRDKNVYQRTYSAVMTHGSMEPVDFYVFDRFEQGYTGTPYSLRYERMCDILVEVGTTNRNIVVVDQPIVHGWPEVESAEKVLLEAGYEGIMLRNPACGYKFGRSTFLEQALLKLKRFKESEAVIEDAEELLRNNNEATIDARGLTVRSSHQENLQGAGTVGALICRDIVTGLSFRLGSGFDMALRDELWKMYQTGTLRGHICKYKFLDYGVVDLPRHPIWLGFRSKEDMS